jgi:ribosomal protein S18 acetylase RimI-like enzyme
MQQPQKYGYIANLCVHKSARRRGIASALLQVAMKVIQNWGLCEVYVHVNATNKPAQALYTKKGFQVLEEESSEGSLEKTVLLRRQI